MTGENSEVNGDSKERITSEVAIDEKATESEDIEGEFIFIVTFCIIVLCTSYSAKKKSS